MSKTKPLQGLLAEAKTLNEEVTAIFDLADAEQNGVATDAQMEQVKEKNKRIAEIEEQAAPLIEQAKARSSARQRDADFTKEPKTAQGGPRRQKSIGEQMLENEDFAEWREKMVKQGAHASRSARIESPRVGFRSLLTGATDTSGGAFVVTDRLATVDAGTFYQPLTVRDLVTQGTTESDMVEYVREGTHTNNAAMVAEATATADGSGEKPESAMVLAIIQETVKNLAHWIPATRRALADAGQLRTLIEKFLRYGLDALIANQIINGSGSGENFRGILQTSGISTQAFSVDILTTARKARTKVLTQGRAMPTAYLMHPLDWEAFDLTQDAEDRYYFGGPSVLGNPRLWGLPVIESEFIAQGTALVADFRMSALWMREQAAIYISDSHSDFFVRNLIAILAEERAAFGVIRPAAFVSIDLTA